MKRCSRCREVKALDEFSNNRTKADGKAHTCKDCMSQYGKTEAYRAYQKARYAATKDVRKLKNKAWRVANADAIRAKKKADYAADPDAHADKRLKRQYGITLSDYNRMLEYQGGLCANPGCFNEPPADRRFDVDHDHVCCPGAKRSCGKCIRGLLCNSCNSALGHADDDIKRLQGLIDYLKRREIITMTMEFELLG